MIIKRKLYSSYIEERDFAKKDYQLMRGGVDIADDIFRSQVKSERDAAAKRAWGKRLERKAKTEDFIRSHPDTNASAVRDAERLSSNSKIRKFLKREASDIRKDSVEDFNNRIKQKQTTRAANRGKADLYSPQQGNTKSARLERINRLRSANGKEVLTTPNSISEAITKQQQLRAPKSTSVLTNEVLTIPNNIQASTTTLQKPQTKITPKNGGSIFNNSFNPMKWSKGAKIGGGIALGMTALGTGAYLYNKNKKKKEN